MVERGGEGDKGGTGERELKIDVKLEEREKPRKGEKVMARWRFRELERVGKGVKERA